MKSSTQASLSSSSVHPESTDKITVLGTRFSFLKDWTLPALSILCFIILWFGASTTPLNDPWRNGEILCDSSSRVPEGPQRTALLEKGGSMIREQLIKHPYHARIWHLYGLYWLRKMNWDSCMYSQRMAITLGSGTTVNSIEKKACDLYNFCLNKKLDPYFKKKDTAITIIQAALIPNYDNPKLDKFLGIIYSNSRDYDSSNQAIFRYLKVYPNDFESLFAVALNYYNQSQYAKSRTYLQKAQQIKPNEANVILLAKYLNDVQK